MQSPELVPPLIITAIMAIITLIIILRSFLKNRMTPSLFYSLAIISFTGLAIDQVLDQTYQPFRQSQIIIDGVFHWTSNLLLAIFAVAGFIFWYLAIIFSQYEVPPRRVLILFFLAGGIIFAEIANNDWTGVVPFLIQTIALFMMTGEVINYARKVIKSTDVSEHKLLYAYFTGYLLWIMALPLGVILVNIPGFPTILRNMWVFPFTGGLMMISYAVAKDPRVLFISDAKPLDILIFSKNQSLLVVHRFNDYPGAVDPELMGSAMSGVITLMKEMLASGKRLLRVDHGDVNILVENGKHSTFLLIATQETSRFRQMLRNALWEFEVNYQEELESDTPVISNYFTFTQRLEEMFL